MQEKKKKKGLLFLIAIIIKNLFLIILEELRNLAKRIGYGKSIAVLVLLAVLCGGGYYWYSLNKNDGLTEDDKLTLQEAAKIGEVTTHKVMVQIENPNGSPEDLKGRYQRGDIVMAVSGEKQFSEAEKTGFLIIKMDLTDKQGELLMRPQEKILSEKDEMGQRIRESVARRKYAVDLEKIGISGGDQRGREIEDKIFKWDVVVEKEQ